MALTAITDIRGASRPVAELDGLRLGYRGVVALDGLSGRIERGSLTAVVGPNGAGKSSLLKALAGAVRPVAGRLRLAPDARIAYLPQASAVDRSFPISVADFVAMGLWRQVGIFRRFGTPAREAIASALASVGIADLAGRPIATLSGGQMQRALFARLALQDAPVILLDEPFSAIDSRTTTALLRIIEGWHGEGRTIVAVLHDLDLVRAHFPRTLLVAGRPVAWGATADVLTAANLAAAREAMVDGDAGDDEPFDMRSGAAA